MRNGRDRPKHSSGALTRHLSFHHRRLHSWSCVRQATPRTAEIAALNEFGIESGSIDGAQGTVNFTQRYTDGSATFWEGRLMRLDNVVDPSNDAVSLALDTASLC